MPVTSSAAGGLSNKEQVAADHCTATWRPWLYGINFETMQVVMYQPNCGSWSCPYCAENNKRRWRWIIGTSAAWHLYNGELISFTTLTSHEKLSAMASISVFPKAWLKLRKRAHRASQGHFCMIPEQHESGRMHVHMLDTFNLPERWWKDNARECGLGYMVESDLAKTAGGAVAYATKYLTKSIGGTWPKNFRRIRTSPGFIVATAENINDIDETLMQSQLFWQWHRMTQTGSLADVRTGFEQVGFSVRVCEASEVAKAIRG